MKIEEIRRENLSLIIETRFGGNRSALAKAVGKADSQIYRIFNKGKNGRPLSSKAARSFELALGIDDGVLDQSIDNHSGRVEICNIGVAKQSQEFVPVISWTQAGQLKNHKLSEGEAPLEWVAKINGGNKVYALYVKGDSMTAPPSSNTRVMMDDI